MRPTAKKGLATSTLLHQCRAVRRDLAAPSFRRRDARGVFLVALARVLSIPIPIAIPIAISISISMDTISGSQDRAAQERVSVPG
jgi:hypothetical protein